MCLKKECIYEGNTLQYIFTKCWKTLETKSLATLRAEYEILSFIDV